MAKGKAAEEIDEGVDEVFTDLHGKPDPDLGGDGANLDDDPMAAAEAEADAEGDDEGDAEPGEGEGDEPGEGEEGEGAEGAEPAAINEPEDTAARDELRTAKLETIAAKAQSLDHREESATEIKARADRLRVSATAALKKAKEAGDTDAELEALNDLDDAKRAIERHPSILQSIENDRVALRGDLQKIGWNGKGFDDPEPTRTAAPKGKPSKLAPTFMAANKWISDPKHKADAGVLYALDQAITAEKKINKDTPEYFAELTKRFNRARPGLVRGLDGKLVATGTRERGTRGSVMPGVGARRAVDPKTIKLDNSDITMMRQFGQDPQNKKHRENWLREKRALARSESRA